MEAYRSWDQGDNMANGTDKIWDGFKTESAFEQRVADSFMTLQCASHMKAIQENEKNIRKNTKIRWMLFAVAMVIGALLSGGVLAILFN